MWQDMVFLVGGIVGAVILLPTLIDSEARVPRRSSVPTMVLLATYTVTFYTLGMNLASFGAVLGTLVWAGIAVLRA
jgi:hypothetical protein